jgi:hypothetical protein
MNPFAVMLLNPPLDQLGEEPENESVDPKSAP